MGIAIRIVLLYQRQSAFVRGSIFAFFAPSLIPARPARQIPLVWFMCFSIQFVSAPGFWTLPLLADLIRWRREQRVRRGRSQARPAPAGSQSGFRVATPGVETQFGGGTTIGGDLSATRTGLGISCAAMQTSLWVAEAAGGKSRLQNLRSDSRRKGALAFTAARWKESHWPPYFAQFQTYLSESSVGDGRE